MKFKRNNKLYVQLQDVLFLESVPDYIINELKNDYMEDCFILFKDAKSIAFWEKKDEIIDYDWICNLTADELRFEITKVQSELNRYNLDWLNSSQSYRQKHLNSYEYNKKISALKYKLSTLELYLSQRSQIVKNCVNCAIDYLNMPYLCNQCNETPAEYKNFIPEKILNKEDKKLVLSKMS